MNHIYRAFEEHRNKFPKIQSRGPHAGDFVPRATWQCLEVFWGYSYTWWAEVRKTMKHPEIPGPRNWDNEAERFYKEARASPPLWRKYRNRKESRPGSGHVSNSTSQENEEKGKKEKEVLVRCLRLQNRHLSPLLKPTYSSQACTSEAALLGRWRICQWPKYINFKFFSELKNVKVCPVYSSSHCFSGALQPPVLTSCEPQPTMSHLHLDLPKYCSQIHLS